MLNWSLIREPFNWATVVLMTAFALLLLSLVTRSPNSSADETE